MMTMKPTYCGWRTRAYGPDVARVPARCARQRTGHAEARTRNPPRMSALLAMWIGFQCGLPSKPSLHEGDGVIHGGLQRGTGRDAARTSA